MSSGDPEPSWLHPERSKKEGREELEEKLVKGQEPPRPKGMARKAKPARGALCPCLADKCLCVFYLMSTVIAIIAMLCIAANIIIISKGPKARDIVIRIFNVILCIMIVFTEFEWRAYLRMVAILRLWPVRGLFYVFVGLSTIENADSADLVSVTGYLLMGAGVVYFVMGILCLRTVKESKLRDIVGYDLDEAPLEDDFLNPRVPRPQSQPQSQSQSQSRSSSKKQETPGLEEEKTVSQKASDMV